MPVTIYGIQNYPHDFLVTKVDAPIEQCAFLLDFGRKLGKRRWFFGKKNRWIGPTVGLLVPVMHLGEKKGCLVIGVTIGEPYFTDIPKLWKQHSVTTSSRTFQQSDELQVLADFARHFPNDCS